MTRPVLGWIVTEKTNHSWEGKPSGKKQGLMAAEDRRLLQSTRGEHAAEDSAYLDDLARGVAEGSISRRRALKLAGAAIVGSTGLLSLFPGMAGAQSSVYGTAVTTAAVGQGGCPEDEPSISNRACEPNPCGGNMNCFCARTVDGNKRCVNLRNARCPRRDECDSNQDCPRGEVCIKVGGCCGNRRRNDCRPVCD